jgi:integrase
MRRICEAYKEGKREEAHSFHSLESALRHALAHFGALRPEEVTPAYVRDYVAQRRKAPKRRGGHCGVIAVAGKVSDKTIDNELRMLRAACAWVKKHLGWKFETPDFVLPGGAQPRKRVLSRKEAAAVFTALAAPETPTHLRVFVLLALLTGQRSGAIRALRWEHIDFDEGMIWFSSAKPKAPKNKRVRDMPMTDRMLAVLQETRADVVARAKSDAARAAIPSRAVIEFKGKPVGSLKTAWAALLRRAGVSGVRIHDLRRTAATGALNRGASMADVALFLNDSEKITARHYAHAAPALLLDVVRRIEGLGEEPEA